jgi:hypothetical protein
MSDSTKTGQVSAVAKTKPHSIRTTESLWLSAKRRADGEGYKINFVVIELLEGYAAGALKLPTPQKVGDSTAKRVPGHSVRSTDALWNSARRRAAGDGLNMNDVITAILGGYSRGLLDLPKVTKTFATPKAV